MKALQQVKRSVVVEKPMTATMLSHRSDGAVGIPVVACNLHAVAECTDFVGYNFVLAAAVAASEEPDTGIHSGQFGERLEAVVDLIVVDHRYSFGIRLSAQCCLLSWSVVRRSPTVVPIVRLESEADCSLLRRLVDETIVIDL